MTPDEVRDLALRLKAASRRLMEAKVHEATMQWRQGNAAVDAVVCLLLQGLDAGAAQLPEPQQGVRSLTEQLLEAGEARRAEARTVLALQEALLRALEQRLPC